MDKDKLVTVEILRECVVDGVDRVKGETVTVQAWIAAVLKERGRAKDAKPAKAEK